jgi:hypothetical protein
MTNSLIFVFAGPLGVQIRRFRVRSCRVLVKIACESS